MNKKILIPAIAVAAVILLILFGRFVLKIGIWKYDSFNELNRAHPVKIRVDIPAGAAAERAVYKGTGIGYSSIYAFTLNQSEYQKFINDIYKE